MLGAQHLGNIHGPEIMKPNLQKHLREQRNVKTRPGKPIRRVEQKPAPAKKAEAKKEATKS